VAVGSRRATRHNDYLVISRGRWDADASAEEIQDAIDRFYAWHDRLAGEGRMKSGRRLGVEGKTVSRSAVTDGPYSESKEVIGGCWFIVAESLEEAARIAAGNPCLTRGLFYEVRPVDAVRCSAYVVTNETARG